MNNRIENLEYTTRRGNEDHAVANGLKATGKRHGAYTTPYKWCSAYRQFLNITKRAKELLKIAEAM